MSFVTEMDGVVGSRRDANEVFWVQNILVEIGKVVVRNRVHVVNQDSVVNTMPRNTQIATVIADNNVIPDPFPFPACVKRLIKRAIMTKRGCT